MFSGLEPIFSVIMSGWIEYLGFGLPFSIQELTIFCIPEPKRSTRPALKKPTAIFGLSSFDSCIEKRVSSVQPEGKILLLYIHISYGETLTEIG